MLSLPSTYTEFYSHTSSPGCGESRLWRRKAEAAGAAGRILELHKHVAHQWCLAIFFERGKSSRVRISEKKRRFPPRGVSLGLHGFYKSRSLLPRPDLLIVCHLRFPHYPCSTRPVLQSSPTRTLIRCLTH